MNKRITEVVIESLLGIILVLKFGS